METVYINPFLLAGAGAIAWVISVIFEKLDKKLHPTVKMLRNDIYTYKCKRLHDKAFYYYYDLMINNPVEFAYDLASKDLKRVKRKGQVNLLYDKLIKRA